MCHYVTSKQYWAISPGRLRAHSPPSATMDLDTGAQDPHQKDFIHTLFHANDGELFHTRPPGPPSAPHMNFTPQPPPMVNMPMSIESFQSLMNPSEGTGQQGMSSQGQATPQSLLEQQMRLNQLQQLQQLQNQIFQQQVSLSFPRHDHTFWLQ